MYNLYVDRRGVEMRADGEALAFYEGDNRIGTVPMQPLSRVYLHGDIRLSASLLGKLGSHDIGVVILSSRKGEVTLLMQRLHNDARLRVLQYQASRDGNICLRVARWLVREKIDAHVSLLRVNLETHPGVRKDLAGAIAILEETASIRLHAGWGGREAGLFFASLRGRGGVSTAICTGVTEKLVSASWWLRRVSAWRA